MKKGEIQAISHFLIMFSILMVLIFHFKCTLKCRLQFVSILTSLQFCHLVMGKMDRAYNPSHSCEPLMCSVTRYHCSFFGLAVFEGNIKVFLEHCHCCCATPASIDRGHIVFGTSVCLCVCRQKGLNLPYLLIGKLVPSSKS